MALIGQGAMPVAIDYSSVGENAWRMAQSNANAIGTALGAAVDVVKDRREKKDKIKVSKELAKALSTLYPESAGAVAPILENLDNEELPLSQRAALGEQIGTLINMGVEKNRNDALMSLERSRLGLETRRVDLAESAYQQEGQAAVAAAMSENDIKAQEALSRYAAIKDMEAPIIGQLPKMDKSEDLITKYLEEGNGEKALNAVEAYESARVKQMEPLLGQPGKKLTQIGADGGTLDVFVSPSGAITDLQGNPLNQAAMGDGVLPPKPGDAAGVVPMEQPAERRVSPMPANLGFRPAADTRTATQQAIDETKLKLAEQELKTAEGAVAKEQSTKQASLANAQDAVALIDRLQNHPGFESAVGTSLTPGFIPATDRKGAEAIIEQLKGQAFLNAIQQLRGLGALSDAEGAKLQQAAARLDPDQSEKDFKQALNEYKAIVQQGIQRLSAQTEGQPAPSQSAADRLRALKR